MDLGEALGSFSDQFEQIFAQVGRSRFEQPADVAKALQERRAAGSRGDSRKGRRSAADRPDRIRQGICRRGGLDGAAHRVPLCVSSDRRAWHRSRQK